MDALAVPQTPQQASKFADTNGFSFPDGQSQSQSMPPPPPVDQSESGTAVKAEAEEDDNSSGIVPTLQNIVATVNLACRLDLKTIALHARNAEYNPKRFAAVIMRIREPKITTAITIYFGHIEWLIGHICTINLSFASAA